MAKQEVTFIEQHILHIQQQQLYPRPLDIDKLRTQQVQQKKAILTVETEPTTTNNIKYGVIQDKTIKQRFLQLLEEYRNIIATHWADCGLIEGVTLKLDLIENAKPICKPPYATSYKLQDIGKQQCLELQKADFIEPSDSQYAFAPFYLPKRQVGQKDIEYRMCIDYRELNKQTIKDKYPLPNINDIQRKFHGKKLFTSLDLRHAYHHIAIAPEDRYKTAFITPFGLYQSKRMSFGFVNAPSTFQ